MSALEAIRAEIPEVTKDLRLNLSQVLDSGTLAPSDRWGVAIAVALAARSRRLAEALIASRPAEVSEKTVEDAVAAAAMMGMTNVFYRFRHLVEKPSYEQKPARLRMQRLAKPATSAASFELYSLAVSAVNACEVCVRSHEATLLEHGVSEDQIHDAVRVAAVVHGAAVALDATALIREETAS
ncbi:MAG TPA: carboxymuconolactone decarboxylase family protein [Polyangiaceae bacterium]|jgi:alkyl hydroperoxide reductase subunit D|nr:carboxymuconolactone decarboxylase family protein [Polyangiaceae bacterium]